MQESSPLNTAVASVSWLENQVPLQTLDVSFSMLPG